MADPDISAALGGAGGYSSMIYAVDPAPYVQEAWSTFARNGGDAHHNSYALRTRITAVKQWHP